MLHCTDEEAVHKLKSQSPQDVCNKTVNTSERSFDLSRKCGSNTNQWLIKEINEFN